METTRARLTVFFEDPFWIGLYERQSAGRYEVCKITFGAEPKDWQVYQYLLENWRKLRFSPPLAGEAAAARRLNPKRLQRLAQREVTKCATGTKAQQALKLQQEQGRTERKLRSKAMREADAEKQFQLHQDKRREKHKGH